MAENDSGDTVRAVLWSEICPWLILVRVFRLAISFRLLLLAAAGVLLTSVGWWFFGSIFAPGNGAMPWFGPYLKCPFEAAVEAVPDRPFSPVPGRVGPAARDAARDNPMARAWFTLSRPVVSAFRGDVSFSGLVLAIFAGLWTVAVWAFFGGAITRIAAVQLACDERIRTSAALRFAARKWIAFFGAPLFPLIGVLLATVPIFFLGLLMRSDFGTLLVAIIWPLLLMLGLLMALLLLGLLFGWPLMCSTISTEGTDSFDALSRSYAYTFQRPLHYLFYVIVAGVLGFLGWLLVENFAAAVVWLTYWAAGWGCGSERLAAVMSGVGAGAKVIRFWVDCVKLVAVGFVFSYFWTATCAIYFLLRRNVDATEMDEVFLEEEEPSYGLPPLKLDSAGAPVVDAAADGDPKGPEEE
jgi:hypothetical protein